MSSCSSLYTHAAGARGAGRGIIQRMERPLQQFASPEDEIRFLREQIAAKERELLSRNQELDHTDVETIGKQELQEYITFTPKMVLDETYEKPPEEYATSLAQIETAVDPVQEVVTIAYEKGLHHALTVLEKQGNAYLTDEVHRRIVEDIRAGHQVQGLKEGVPPWQILHMTLFSVSLPDRSASDTEKRSLVELYGIMQQFFAGMRSVGTLSKAHYVLELAVADKSDDIVLYIAVPNQHVDLFEKQILSLYPHIQLEQQMHDYNIFVSAGESAVAVADLKRHPIYPLRHGEQLSSDAMLVLLNAFSKIERDGGGASLQCIIKPKSDAYLGTYHNIIKRVEGGMKPADSIAKSTLGGEMMLTVKEMFGRKDTKKNDLGDVPKEIDVAALDLFKQKIATPIIDTNIRLVVSAHTAARAQQILQEVEATFNQFSAVESNAIVWRAQTGARKRAALKAYSFREFLPKDTTPLSEAELATIFHLPENTVGATPQLRQSYAKTAPAPTEMPQQGTYLGENIHRGVERNIFLTEADRMRHFYIIGQTGTGKSVFMKNLIIQDIFAGAGVCMIDPHGTDIQDVLAAVPPERAQDIIYFDPADREQVIGLNMLEYDPHKPEQMTFVVNELFSIFQKLYGANPESMGPMFEQYFRNATLLVMESPELGNTLMDVSRVMSDAKYRRAKLERAKNPVVTQFWREIATKAGGEASLENIVPYIVSKFDVFTANEYMRPIIGQQSSSFNFRTVMDTRKILLVNLSKGRLGDINANLIGMIVVGKLLMAALSRVDTPSEQLSPFFLHIDEFQNVSTPSISAILSEARKYKLGLVVAHQFIAQLDERIRDAVFGNVGSLASFRVGPEDAQFLEHQLGPTFSAGDIMNIPNYQAYVRVLANGVPTTPFSLLTPPPPTITPEHAAQLRAVSAARYGRSRAVVEAEIAERYKKPTPPTGITASPM